MFQFLQPIWFSALAGIAAPVIIHLWNQRPGKTMKVGSVALVTESIQRYQNRLQVSEILLLILRCLLVAMVALALATPQWRSAKAASTKGWVLMNRHELAAAYQHFKPSVDSLLAAGYEFHFFEPGFKQEQLQQALTNNSPADTVTVSYRDIIAALDREADASLPLYIFTNQYLRNFYGERSAVALNLHWQMYADSTILPQQAATTSLRITIFSQHHPNDVRYLQAALEAIRQVSKKNLTVNVVTDMSRLPAQQDWLYWLEETDFPTQAYAANVLSYAEGKQQRLSSVILAVSGSLFSPAGINKLIAAKDSFSQGYSSCWQDGFGHPVLTVQRRAGQNRYQLYTHISPEWNELPWSDNFPSILYGLLYPRSLSKTVGKEAGNTIIDYAQAMPLIRGPKDHEAKPVTYNTTPLADLCWLIAFILLLAERSLSYYYFKAGANG